MSLEVISNEENQLLDKGQVTGYKCKDFNLAARGCVEGGKIVIKVNEGQTSQKRIVINFINGDISIVGLGIKVNAKKQIYPEDYCI